MRDRAGPASASPDRGQCGEIAPTLVEDDSELRQMAAQNVNRRPTLPAPLSRFRRQRSVVDRLGRFFYASSIFMTPSPDRPSKTSVTARLMELDGLKDGLDDQCQIVSQTLA
jgi:hypothetical protein